MTESTASPQKARASVTEMFEAPRLSPQKLPQLRALFERLAGLCVEDFKHRSPTAFTCFVNQVDAGDSWDVLDAYEDCVAGVFYVSEWDASLLIALERRFLFSAVEAMYGGDGTEPAFEQVRSYSGLELTIAKDILEQTARAFQAAFAPLAPITVSLERVETSVEFTILGPQSIPSVFAQLLFQVFDGGGRMLLLVPRSPLQTLRKKLERATLREAQTEDPQWSRQMQTRVATTEVTIRALVDGPVLSLQDVANLRPGQILPLAGLSGAGIVVESAQAELFRCGLGKLNGHLCVEIESIIDRTESLSEVVLTAAMVGWDDRR